MSKNLALFIDCDKLEVAFMSVIFDYLKNQGYNVCVKKAYINKDNLLTWYNQLERQYCRVVLGNSQANTNMNISVDVAKALYSGKYQAIAIASNYKEFGVLASSIRAQGLESICFYQYSKGNEAYLKRAYNVVYNLEPTHSKPTHVDMDNTNDMLEAFGAALEGLDTKLLGETLQGGDDDLHFTTSATSVPIKTPLVKKPAKKPGRKPGRKPKALSTAESKTTKKPTTRKPPNPKS